MITIPDMYFWYSLSIAMAGLLIWIIQRYISKTEKLLEKLVTDVSELKERTSVHNHRINELEDNLADEIVLKLKAITPKAK
jgi:hypothetical protein